ncbi:MAG TPA: FAD-dependent oxidoreductase [Burkholderiales bacterium]
MKVVVLGAGLAGLTTAWYLATDGHEVEVVERETAVASLASFANGGIIAASRAFPWPGPQMKPVFLKAFFRNDQALRVRLRIDPEFWAWGLKFLANCGAARYAQILEAKMRLVRYSQECLDALVRAQGIDYGRLQNGVLYVHRSEAALEAGWKRAQSAIARGLPVERLDATQLAALEPALAARAADLSGALHAPQDEAGDSARFCRELESRLRQKGARFHLGCEVTGLNTVGTDVRSVVTTQGAIPGDAFVCALGVMPGGLRRQFGAPLPVYPVKGYSMTLPLARPERAPAHAGIDEGRLMSWCPTAEGLRVTGGAEFAGHARTHRPADFQRLADVTENLFPGAVDAARAETRVCQRPMTPESTPRFGAGRFENLFFNVGLGHMGWAMAAGAGRISADLVAGRSAAIDLEGLRIREA